MSSFISLSIRYLYGGLFIHLSVAAEMTLKFLGLHLCSDSAHMPNVSAVAGWKLLPAGQRRSTVIYILIDKAELAKVSCRKRQIDIIGYDAEKSQEGAIFISTCICTRMFRYTVDLDLPQSERWNALAT